MANIPAPADHRRTTPASRLPRKPSLANPAECEIYFLAGAGLIKIGITTNMMSRLRAIRNSSPVSLELLARAPGCTFLEMRLHAEFAHLRRHGEWFEDDGSIRAHIAECYGAGNNRPRTRLPSSLGLTAISMEVRHG